MYIYKFLNEQNNVIYIGRTNNIIRRIRNEHFGTRGHLVQACYNSVARVEVAEVASLNEAKMYELFYIERYHPKYNTADIGGGAFSFPLTELVWKNFDFDTSQTRTSKQELLTLMNDFNQEIDTECKYASNLLRDQDNKPWLAKLEPTEQNEYLHLLYSIERFVESVSERNHQVLSKIK